MRQEIEATGLEIAVIGMGCRFPGAESIDELYNNLKNGVESIEFLSREELLELGVSQSVLEDPHFVHAKSTFKSIEGFDSDFFEYTPQEALIMDPQIRVMHECVWEAIENAGYGPLKYDKPVGLFVGGTSNQYWEYITLFKQIEKDDIYDSEKIAELFSNSLFNNMDLMSTRISFKLDLRGPSINLFSSCSTSLAAVHLACQSLLNGDCDMAVAGGASIMTPQRNGYIYKEGLILSRDGHCRIFDEQSSGTVFGDGVGLVVLKRLEDALNDKDTIHAVIRGSAMNNDGNRKIGYAAPSLGGQVDVIKKALDFAELSSDDLQFIEVHGTGTYIGDPIEFQALAEVFTTTQRKQCALSSIKTNFGHLNSAAGVAGLIKAVLVVKYGELFPTLNFENPNENLDFENSPFYINTELIPLRGDKHEKIYGGVSSFGAGGTNVHVILESPPVIEKDFSEEDYTIIGLSAKTPSALEKQTSNLLDFLKLSSSDRLGDISYTLMTGRENFAFRRAFICKERQECITLLEGRTPRQVVENEALLGRHKIVYMFPGQGAEYPQMGKKLYRQQPAFREEMDRCFEYFRACTSYDLKSFMDATTPIAPPEASRGKLFLLFSFECALAKLLQSWGIHPEMVIGYSFGELAAAYIAGIFTLKDLIEFIVFRNDLMESVPKGAMLSVPLPYNEVKALLQHNVEIAIDNGESCIVGGLEEDVRLFEKQMKSKKLLCFPVNIPFASHTHVMKTIIPDLEDFLARLSLQKPDVPIISGISGKELSPQLAVSPAYWAGHIGETINFCKGAQEVSARHPVVFLEIGPGMDLTNLMKRDQSKASSSLAFDLVKANGDTISEEQYLLNRLMSLWTQGVNVKWQRFYERGNFFRVPLPAYPFERKVYPIYKEDHYLPSDSKRHLVRNAEIKDAPDDWFYQPSWKLAPLPEVKKSIGSCILVFSDSSDRASKIKENLSKDNQIVTVTRGEAFSKVNNWEYIINPGNKADYEKLFETLQSLDAIPDKLIHLFSAYEAHTPFDTGLRSGFFSLLYIFQTFDFAKKTSIYVVSEGLYRVYGHEKVYPEKSLMLALIKIMSQENINIACFYIDTDESTKIEVLLAQFNHLHPVREIALRLNKRWERSYERVSVGAGGDRLKQNGVYLITGGLGNIGLSFASYLTRRYNARVILVGKTALPDENQWESILQNKEDKNYNRVLQLLTLKEEKREFQIFTANVADIAAMKNVIAECETSWGRINGVIHAAGMTGANLSRTISLITPQECYEQFEPKVHGTQVLYELFKEYGLDFMVLLSSLSPILGGLGYTVYAAANGYLDSFFEALDEEMRDFLICINWETWDFKPQETQSLSKLGESNALLALSEEESHQVLERVLAHRGNHFVVSSGDLARRIDKWIGLSSVKTAAAEETTPFEGKSSFGRHGKERPQLLTPYKEAETDTQKKLLALWTDFLGITGIGMLDNFFELGADSLKAVVMISKISKELKKELPLMQFFKNPTIAETASFMEKNTIQTSLSISRAQPKDLYALSPAQKRLYLIQSIIRESCLYNETQAFIIEGEIAHAKMEAVFHNIIHRHEILRTVYQLTGEKTDQIVLADPDFYITRLVIDDPSALEAVVDVFRRPFDLDKELPIRIGLGKIAENKHLLIIDIHHIATDGISDNIIIRDFTYYYNEQVLPEMKIQYKDYAEWLNSVEQQKVQAGQRDFWLNEFRNGYTVVNLPTDFKRPPIREETGGQVAFTVNKETTLQLLAMVKYTDSTLFILLLSLFNLLIARLTGQDRILIGVPIAGRRSPDLEDLIGVFVNLLAVQTEIDADLRLDEFVSRFKEKMIRLYDNQEFPFEELIEELNVDRDPSRNPFIDIVFVMQSPDDFVVELPAVTISKLSYQSKVAKYDLQCTAFLQGDELELLFDYNASLFKEASIRRMGNCFIRLLDQVKEKITEKVSRLDLMTKEEEALCFLTGGEAAMVSATDTILQLFDEQAHKYPSNVAVRFGNEEITYGELLVSASKLANKMRKDGVGPGTVVALYFRPCIEMIIAILATLKSGGAYLPIDVEYPEQRCKFMLQDSGSSCLLTKRDIHHHHLSVPGNIYYVDDKGSYADEPEKIENINSASDIVYIIYTSGTTGKPKGVMVEHRNLYSLFVNTRTIFDFNEKDAWTLFHSYCFDFSVWEIWGALLFGGKLYVLSQEERKDTRQFLKILSRENITVLNQTPSAFYNLSDELSFTETISLNIRSIIFGGEALTPARLKKWSKLFPDVKFINMYGITETTVHATIKGITPTDIEENTSSIGVPIPGMCAYILDSNGSSLPPGVYGELFVGGAGVTQGYLNRPELTDKVFRRNMYKPSERVFKTGDRVRLTDEGEIEYAGRVDRQVQLRGFRIELGEIEHHLLMIPAISDAVVITNNGDNENLHIIAYYVSECEYKPEEIKAFLSTVLPDYMIPSFVMKIESIPLTSNKKIHYSLLPDPKEAMELKQEGNPENETEQKMLTLWGRVLQLEEEKISVFKNFFDLGGNSLKIMHLKRLILDELETDIPVVYLFQHTTIRSLVHFMKNGLTTSDSGSHHAIESALDEGKKRMESMLRRNRRK